jgi:hypothetical protein
MTVSLSGHSTIKIAKPKTVSKPNNKTVKPSTKDEQYVLDICDKVLQQTSSRQHKFDFWRNLKWQSSKTLLKN